jgi:hypothetical protein
MDSVDLMSLTKPNSSVRVVGRPVGVWDGEHVEVDAAGLDEAELWMFGDGLFSAKKMGAGSWQRTVRLHPADEPHTVEFSPLGRYALVDADKFVSILSTADGHTLGQLSVRDRLQVATYSFDANEKSFARVLEGELTVFDLLRGMEYEHLRSKASAASMSRNGRLVAHGDGQRVMVRRVSDGVVLSTITVSRPVRQILFGHDDQFLVVATDSTVSAHVWQLDHIRRIACERAGPGLSADVWQKFFAGQRYRFTCTH